MEGRRTGERLEQADHTNGGKIPSSEFGAVIIKESCEWSPRGVLSRTLAPERRIKAITHLFRRTLNSILFYSLSPGRREVVILSEGLEVVWPSGLVGGACVDSGRLQRAV